MCCGGCSVLKQPCSQTRSLELVPHHCQGGGVTPPGQPAEPSTSHQCPRATLPDREEVLPWLLLLASPLPGVRGKGPSQGSPAISNHTHPQLTRSGASESGCLFLRDENLCWLRTEKRRKDSRLREARCRKEEARLNGLRLAVSPLLSVPTVAVTTCRAS